MSISEFAKRVVLSISIQGWTAAFLAVLAIASFVGLLWMTRRPRQKEKNLGTADASPSWGVYGRWGGFGGGRGGWQITPGLGLLLLTVFFATALAVVAGLSGRSEDRLRILEDQLKLLEKITNEKRSSPNQQEAGRLGASDSARLNDLESRLVRIEAARSATSTGNKPTGSQDPSK